MKFSIVQALIAIGISGLIAYGFYSFHESENKVLLSFGSFFFLAITLLFTIGVSFNLPRTTTMVSTLSGIFFAIALASNLAFSFFIFSAPVYVMINGILLMVFTLAAYTIKKAEQ